MAKKSASSSSLESLTNEQVKAYMDAFRLQPSQRDWNRESFSYRYDTTVQWESTTTPTSKEDDDMAAKTTPRNLYTIAVVSIATDEVEVKHLVAETEEEARFTVVRGLPGEPKASDYEIKILDTTGLKARSS